MGVQAEDPPAIEHPHQPVNPPLQPVNSLPLPSRFDGTNNPNQADMWLKWLRYFEHYQIASGLQSKSNQEQVGTFLYAMGDCADDIIEILSINKKPLPTTKSKQHSMAILQPSAMSLLNEHSTIDKGKTLVNLWAPSFKTYTALPTFVSTEL